MRTVITHFFNEEYLLPWWLEHHRNLFDYGVLIDYGSTDNSLDICRTLAPNWRLVRSRNLEFAALSVDFEVMQYEAELPDWKMALNVTEFLYCGNLLRLETEILGQNRLGSWICAAVMVDPYPDVVPLYEQQLFKQKSHGFLEQDYNFVKYIGRRSRLYHRAEIGAYLVGRHRSQLPNLTLSENPALVLWYGYSPWRPELIRRKLQISTKIPVSDQRIGWGREHLTSYDELERRRAEMLPHVTDLSHRIRIPEREVKTKGVNIAVNCRASQSSVYGDKAPTAYKVVDGIKSGVFDFHTKHESNPWWIVDLGRVATFDEILVFNILNVQCAPRSRWLQVLLSCDGETWNLIYSHDGTTFGGIDGYPLRVTKPRMIARFVKLQLPGSEYLHLDEVEIYDHVAVVGGSA